MAKAERKYDNSIAEEASAIGQRAKGAVKETIGSLTNNPELEREGERENLEGRLRQNQNDVLPNKDKSGAWPNKDESGTC